MATLALAAAGAAVGNTLLPTGISFLGASISGATIGAQIGAFAGSYVDQALFGSSGDSQPVHGPRLNDLRLLGSNEGAPIPKVYGRARVGGHVIWADELEEVVKTSSSGGGGGKGIGSGGGGASTTTVTYKYYASFAVALAEGEVTAIEKIWADNQELNLSHLTYRLYSGDENQLPDSLIKSRLGAGNAPAFRGCAYVVFERLPLRDYGNRIPQLSFQIVRPVDSFAAKVKSVVMIPGSGEFAYAPEPVNQTFGGGFYDPENVHTLQAGSDWAAALDQLEVSFPNLEHVSLVVSWFGTDLRAGDCELKPGVERSSKSTKPISWSVAGRSRQNAYVVSQRDGRPAYGGTPTDESVVAAIEDLTARGFKVTFNPFILMDVEAGNTLPNPYDGSAAQPTYPWRGRITVDPAPGQPSSPDKSSAAATQVSALVGTSAVSDFHIIGQSVNYSGPNEWTLRRMVLHYAHLVKAAGGVDSFLLGSELRGLSWVRDGAGSYPFVAALEQLAADVKSILGSSTKVSYGADWSEFFGHQPQDGSGDVYFHLDPLWASPNIDAVSIDVYWPLADWRDGTDHLDYTAGARSVYDLTYLRGNVASGEGFDWYYASQGDRDAQIRTPITDGQGKPWVFRFKDIKSWWENAHFNRPGGVEGATATAWVPQSKPFWFTEVGCPAVDKGANQPNVFSDPKSSENALPYYSNGVRDDLMQRRYNDVFVSVYDPSDPDYVPGTNPTSTVDGRMMVDPERIYLYAWDARPYPAFPFNTEVWGDGDNWHLGHWLTGRASKAPLSEAVARILGDYGFEDFDADQLVGSLTGFLIDRVMSPRDALQALSLAFFFDARESNGKIVFSPRGRTPPVGQFETLDLVETKPGANLLTLKRGQETDLPASAKVRYIANRVGLNQSVAEARRLVGASGRIAQADLPIILEPEEAEQIAETWLHEAWLARENASFSLPPSKIAVEPGDVVDIDVAGDVRSYRIKEISGLSARDVDALSIDPDVYGGFEVAPREDNSNVSVVTAEADVLFLDLPILRGDESPLAGYVAASQSPWPGVIAVYGSPDTSGFVLRTLVSAPATMGTLTSDMPAGPLGVFDRGTKVTVSIGVGILTSTTQLQLFSGKNVAAVRTPEGDWEVFQFETATLISPGTYELSGLLRGQAGTEGAMRYPLAAGAPFVLLQDQVAALELTLDELRLPYQWTYGPATRDLSDPTYGALQHTFQGIGLRPYAPVHVHAERNNGDLHISWVRRTRIGGDSWDTIEVPLSEDQELYEVDILDGTAVKRTLQSTTPSVTYLSADQVSDFGAAQSSVHVKIYQLSTFFGRGEAQSAVL